MDWQRYVLDDALTIGKNGKFVRNTCGILVARQQGKTHLMRMRILAGMYIFGEKQTIAMAQNRQLALDTFRQTVDMAESLTWMRKRIKRVSRTNGQEELEIYCHHYPKECNTKCNRIRKYGIRAATSEGARGATADLLYIDELREISEEAWTAATPLTRATGGQIYVSSNAGDAGSTVLNELRARALTFKSDRLGWFEWSAPPDADIYDVEAWRYANPALGHTVSLESLQDSAARDSADAIKTEMLCQWISSTDSPFSADRWKAGADNNLRIDETSETYMGLDLSFNREHAFLVTVQVRDDKFAIFLTRWHRDGGLLDSELASELAGLARKYNARTIAFDPKTAGHIAAHLQRVGVHMSPTSWASTQFSTFCDMTLSALNAESLIHPNQETMFNHLMACSRRPSSDGGWRIARQASVQDIGAAVAMVLALGHATAPKPKISLSVV